MFRIWAKVMCEGKILSQTTYEREEKFTYARFFDYLAEICHELDIPTPDGVCFEEVIHTLHF